MGSDRTKGPAMEEGAGAEGGSVGLGGVRGENLRINT